MPDISFYAIAFYFLIYSFLGWCMEVVFCSIDTGKFVNRGFLNGPLCPIYGFGAVILILILTPIAGNLLVLYVGSVLLTSALELVTGFLLKKLFHTSWWDYSDQRFNLGGYICLKFSLLWGLAGIVLMRVLHPLLSGLVDMIPHVLGIILLIVAYAAVITDAVVTVNAITKMNRDLGELAKIAKGLHQGSEATAEALGTRAIAMAKKVEELDLEGRKQQLTEKIEEQRNALMEKNARLRKRLLRAFPNMKNTRHPKALEELRTKLTLGRGPKKEAVGEDAEADVSTRE